MAQIQKRLTEPRDYVLKEDKSEPEEKQTHWRIKPLSNKDLATVIDMAKVEASDDGKAKAEKQATAALFAFSRGCVGFDKWTEGEIVYEFIGELGGDSDGLKRLSKKELGDIPFEWQTQIGAEIISISMLSKEQKN